MFRRLKGKLRVEISLDDFFFIGKNGKKFLAGYISCTNLPLKKQTKRDNIYLFLMVKRPSTRIFEAMNQILKPFVDEMKLLEKNGITIDNENGETTKIDVTLSKVVCDNLAKEGFKSRKLSNNSLWNFGNQFSSNCGYERIGVDSELKLIYGTELKKPCRNHRVLLK